MKLQQRNMKCYRRGECCGDSYICMFVMQKGNGKDNIMCPDIFTVGDIMYFGLVKQ
jgi:hypothetical protein